MEAAVCCPICLASPDDLTDEPSSPSLSATSAVAYPTLFVKTPCGHIFCIGCIERVLLKPRGAGIPTRAPCPMCRKIVNLFDLCHATSNSLVYDNETDMTSWSTVLNSQFRQRPLTPLPNAEVILEQMMDQKGVIEGFGITFCFQEPTPSMKFSRPLIAHHDYDGDRRLDSITLDRTYFHHQSMTFHGKISFANPVCSNDNYDSYFYEELDCLLQFSSNGQYIRKGELQWKIASTPIASFPLDGTWEVQYSDGESSVICVQKHFFSCSGSNYRITIDPDHRPRFTWPEQIEQTSTQQVLPGTSGPDVGETLKWATSQFGFEQIVWKRLATNLDNYWRSFNILPGIFVYQKCHQHPHNDQSLGPSYQADTLWGNVFCQSYSVGLASYHFLDPDSDGNFQAYISYESPKTEMWPSLDNGERVPSRVPFRNISFQPETKTFKGDICWEQDFGTTWENESKWSYEIVFDPTFMFVVSGTCSHLMGEPHQFGIDLIYINSAIEIKLRTSLAAQTAGSYLDIVRQWSANNASTATLQMLGDVALAVMGDREGMIDFNL